jgi:hypothetical protein
LAGGNPLEKLLMFTLVVAGKADLIGFEFFQMVGACPETCSN